VQRQVPDTRMNWTIMRAEDPAGLDRLPAAQWQFATLTFRIKGRASHAGVAPAAGINAVVEAAALVRRVTDAASRFPEARLHWRAASGGLISNIIPERGMALLEVAAPKAADLAPLCKP
jgi:metal-dependent amidase/aminoacylase/carboxypeptidase family protein